MRQVKFRYWNGSKVLNQEAIINHLNKYIARNDKHLMQFTGLFDKQGVDIYEGDIVSCQNKVGQVKYEKSMFVVDFIKAKGHLFSISDECIVIGNIYEHSHLINNKQELELEINKELWEEIRVLPEAGKSLNKKDKKMKTKEQLIFQDNFIEKIKQGIKTKTIRNSPVTLGTKKLSDEVSIDVYKVERVLMYPAKFKMKDVYHIISIDEGYPTVNQWATANEPFGFNTLEQMFNYYRTYIKRDDAFLIHFKLIGK